MNKKTIFGLYAAGLLRDYDEETAMALMKASIR